MIQVWNKANLNKIDLKQSSNIHWVMIEFKKEEKKAVKWVIRTLSSQNLDKTKTQKITGFSQKREKNSLICHKNKLWVTSSCPVSEHPSHCWFLSVVDVMSLFYLCIMIKSLSINICICDLSPLKGKTIINFLITRWCAFVDNLVWTLFEGAGIAGGGLCLLYKHP